MKLFVSQLIYLGVLVLYFLILKFISLHINGFDVVVFDYPRHGLVLCLVFLSVNLLFLRRHQLNRFYSLTFYWLPFFLFLVVTAVVFFYGFISIGAPFKQNVFANLFIAHSVAFSAAACSIHSPDHAPASTRTRL